MGTPDTSAYSLDTPHLQDPSALQNMLLHNPFKLGLCVVFAHLQRAGKWGYCCYNGVLPLEGWKDVETDLLRVGYDQASGCNHRSEGCELAGTASQ